MKKQVFLLCLIILLLQSSLLKAEAAKDGYSKHFILGPFYIKTEDKRIDLVQHDVLYPLFRSKKKGEESLTWLMPFWMHQSSPQRTLNASLFLHWYKRDEVNDKTRLSFLWLIPPDLLSGSSEIATSGLSLLWYEGSPTLKRHGLFPLYSYKQNIETDLEFSQFFLFFRKQQAQKSLIGIIPFWMHQSTPNHTTDASLFLHWYKHDQGKDKTNLSFLWLIPPDLLSGSSGFSDSGLSLMWYADSPTLTQQGLFPLYSYERNTAEDSRFSQVLLFINKQKAERSYTTIIPFWAHQSSPWHTIDTSLFLHWYKHDQANDKTSLSFLWLVPPNLLSRSSAFYDSGLSLIRYMHSPTLIRHGLFPLYSYEKNRLSNSMRWSFLSPLISYRSDGALSSETGFLWKVITYEQKDADTSDFRFLWRLIRWSKTKESVAFEFNPLYSYESKKGEGSYWAILGGLIGKETAEDGSSKMRWFWFL